MSLRKQRVSELEAVSETFSTEGYKLIEAEQRALYNALLHSAVDSCDTGEKWLVRRGELLNLARIIAYRQAAELEIEHLPNAVFEDEVDPRDGELNPLED